MRPSSSQESAFWTKNRRGLHDGKGFNVDLIAVPVGGRLVIRRAQGSHRLIMYGRQRSEPFLV
ncbi:hypothetical protein [Bradyrhizobium sp. CCBAU 11434]|uniref:hypothetical protein n=1 Tax=Bradyrhizobium sp. CCBAU 11434 TaxID=1630885 RepID=UPI002305DB2C|nr:hypothetical protein [Bradyrhizobium sp. CCBAU 11434]